MILVRRGSLDPRATALCEAARARGVVVREVSDADLRRMSAAGAAAPDPELLGMWGPDPRADLATTLARGGALWLLAGAAYPGNAGYAIRTAEVSGAAGIAIEAAFAPEERRRALRFSMHAERFFPVLWERADRVIARARERGRVVYGLEDVGTRAPWEIDLTGSAVFVIGAEGAGIPPVLLELCDAVLTLPMAGFVPAYNVQAAIAGVALERLRQLSAKPGGRER